MSRYDNSLGIMPQLSASKKLRLYDNPPCTGKHMKIKYLTLHF
jgi:hypothetical protein